MEINKQFTENFEKLMSENAAEALAYAMKIQEENDNPELHVYIADALMALDDFAGAVEEINEGLAKGIKNKAFANSLKGEALFYLGRYEESREVFLEILAENPNSFFAVAYLTDIDINLKNYTEGIERAEKVLASNTLNSRDAAYIQTNIGWINLKYLGKEEEAFVNFNNAKKLDDTLGTIYIGLGVYYLNKEEYEKALENFEKAIELDEGTVEVYFNIGKCYKAMGQLEDAFEYFKIVKQYDENYPGIKEELS